MWVEVFNLARRSEGNHRSCRRPNAVGSRSEPSELASGCVDVRAPELRRIDGDETSRDSRALSGLPAMSTDAG
jgi:hypothetical protein